MGSYNTGSETSLPYAAQPPLQYDLDYMRRLVATVNRLVESSQLDQGASVAPAKLIVGNLRAGQTASVALLGLPSLTATVSAITAGSNALVGTVTAPGALTSNPVAVSASPAPPAGVFAFGKVTANDTVSIEVLNQSGSSYSGNVTFYVAVLTQ